MKLFIGFLAMFAGLNMAISQNITVDVSIDNKIVTLTNKTNTSNFPNDSFRINWNIQYEGEYINGTNQFSTIAYFRFVSGGNYSLVIQLEKWTLLSSDSGFWNFADSKSYTLNITANNTYQISGNITSKGNLVKSGTAYLLKKDIGNNIRTIRMAPITDNGTYTLTNLVNDTFMLWIQPIIDTLDVLYSTTIPKYFGNSIIIDSALPIIINNQNQGNINIDLDNGAQPNGDLTLSGRIISNSNLDNKKVSLLLLSQDKSVVASHAIASFVDKSYTLAQLNSGTYYLQAIIEGKPSGLKLVTLNANSTIDIEIDQLTTSKKELLIATLELKVYPNPNFGEMNIPYDSEKIRRITVTNSKGEIVIVMTADIKSQLDFTELGSGFYFLTIETKNEGTLVTKFNKQ